jgi:hypothetical protein
MLGIAHWALRIGHWALAFEAVYPGPAAQFARYAVRAASTYGTGATVARISVCT